MARASAAIATALWLVRTRPQGQLVAARAGGADGTVSEPQLARARRLALAVDRVASYGPFVGPLRPACLARSIALSRLLEQDGIRGAHVKVGVRRREQRFEAHAWVELGNTVVGDVESHVQSFAPLADVRVAEVA